jgi:hypothetical protein
MEFINMLHNSTIETENIWSRLQQPAHASQLPADYMRLLSALDEGWIIVEATQMLASGRNDEGRGYLLTLIHKGKLIVREITVARTLQIDALLAYEGVPSAN